MQVHETRLSYLCELSYLLEHLPVVLSGDGLPALHHHLRGRRATQIPCRHPVGLDRVMALLHVQSVLLSLSAAHSHAHGPKVDVAVVYVA